MTCRRPSPAAWTAVERKAIAVPLRTSSSIVWLDAGLLVVAEGLDPAGALAYRSEPGVGRELEHAMLTCTRLRTSMMASQVLDLDQVRLWPALAAAPVRPVLTESIPFSGPSVYVPGN